jgi:hypothetical protein
MVGCSRDFHTFALVVLRCYFAMFGVIYMLGYCRKEGQDTTEEVRKRDLREELEDRERRHFSSKDRSYGEVLFILLVPQLLKFG